MRDCALCRQPFDPAAPVTEAAVELGIFLAGEFYGDGAELCQECLASRGRLGMMYLREFD